METIHATRWGLQLMKMMLLLFAVMTPIPWGFAQPAITLTPVITTGLSLPTELVNAGDGSHRIFIVQKGGSILAYDSSYNFLSTFLTVANISGGGERGLLSMAFHPAYTSNGFFYVYYTNPSGDLEVARYHVSSNPNVADTAKVIVITIPHPTNANHNGGELHFGNDGYLYLSTGDGGGAGDVPNNAQDTTRLLGKILRFNVNTSATLPFYTIPAGNPYGNEIYHRGLRNPFRWSFDRLTHDMWIGDVGQDSWEEVDYRPASAGPGQNFGWRCYEGNVTFNTTGCSAISNYVFPVYTYPTQNPSASIIGGVVYRGPAYPALRGWYMAADFYSGTWYKLHPNGTGGWDTSTQALSPTGITNFGESEKGEAYAVSLTGNSVLRIGTNSTGLPAEPGITFAALAPAISADGQLYLTLDPKRDYRLLEIYSINGARVFQQDVNGYSGRQQFPLQELSPGMYMIRLSGGGGTYVQRIVKP